MVVCCACGPFSALFFAVPSCLLRFQMRLIRHSGHSTAQCYPIAEEEAHNFLCTPLRFLIVHSRFYGLVPPCFSLVPHPRRWKPHSPLPYPPSVLECVLPRQWRSQYYSSDFVVGSLRPCEWIYAGRGIQAHLCMCLGCGPVGVDIFDALRQHIFALDQISSRRDCDSGRAKSVMISCHKISLWIFDRLYGESTLCVYYLTAVC